MCGGEWAAERENGEPNPELTGLGAVGNVLGNQGERKDGLPTGGEHVVETRHQECGAGQAGCLANTWPTLIFNFHCLFLA